MSKIICNNRIKLLESCCRCLKIKFKTENITQKVTNPSKQSIIWSMFTTFLFYVSLPYKWCDTYLSDTQL